MSSKLEALKELKKEINLTIQGLENYPTDAPSLIVANHNCLMDIFYMPASIPEASISLISPRLIYKPIRERQKQIENYLYALPIEAHGGPLYTRLCLENAASMLTQGISTIIFPEGAYIPEKDIIHRGRTGMARILFQCRKKGIKVHLLPAAIQIQNQHPDLDRYFPSNEIVKISLLKPIDYDSEAKLFLSSKDKKIKNIALHQITDKAMQQIAVQL
ncbi:MAG: 1-acyl-sn-glycerol-3-phosphate acyltransferase [Bacilli bacterium]|nr:1-acyl-sn-glycerol-3-phosphate acyltransferase [Bacilli bacterium]